MRSRSTTAVATALMLGLVAPAGALGVGPSPGVIVGNPGASWQGHAWRFVAAPGGLGTVIREVRGPGASVVRSRSIPGDFGVPAVAFDGSTELLPPASATLVLAARNTPLLPRETTFVVLSTRDLHVVRRVALPGVFAFDALSPDGETVYLTEHTSAAHVTRYRVRAYDLRGGRLLPGVIADRSTGEWRMDGIPTTRLQTASGGWAYTLYMGGDGGAFVHALDTRTRTAHCIDLAGMRRRNVMAMRLRLTNGGTRLAVRAGTRTVATIDLRPFRSVHAAAAPAPQASASGPSARIVGLAATAILLLIAASIPLLRRRMQHNPAHGGRS